MPGDAMRVYADTSVFGGCFDEEFAEESRGFFNDVRRGRFVLVVSPVLLRELEGAPEEVRRVLADLPDEYVESMGDDPGIMELREAYLAAGVVGESCRSDAEHVASGTVADVDLIASWNFKHIVHFDKISGYNGVNLLTGRRLVRIFSPREVVDL